MERTCLELQDSWNLTQEVILAGSVHIHIFTLGAEQKG